MIELKKYDKIPRWWRCRSPFHPQSGTASSTWPPLDPSARPPPSTWPNRGDAFNLARVVGCLATRRRRRTRQSPISISTNRRRQDANDFLVADCQYLMSISPTRKNKFGFHLLFGRKNSYQPSEKRLRFLLSH
jgi:hypothetical protein